MTAAWRSSRKRTFVKVRLMAWALGMPPIAGSEPGLGEKLDLAADRVKVGVADSGCCRVAPCRLTTPRLNTKDD